MWNCSPKFIKEILNICTAYWDTWKALSGITENNKYHINGSSFAYLVFPWNRVNKSRTYFANFIEILLVLLHHWPSSFYLTGYKYHSSKKHHYHGLPGLLHKYHLFDLCPLVDDWLIVRRILTTFRLGISAIRKHWMTKRWRSFSNGRNPQRIINTGLLLFPIRMDWTWPWMLNILWRAFEDEIIILYPKNGEWIQLE